MNLQLMVLSVLVVIANTLPAQFRKLEKNGTVRIAGIKHDIIMLASDSNLLNVVQYHSASLNDGTWCAVVKGNDQFCRCRFNVKDGRMDGLFLQYDRSGRLHSKREFWEGIENGCAILWTANGTLRSLGMIKNNRFDGTVLRFNKNGKIRSTDYWYQGLLIGEKQFLFPKNSQLIQQLLLNDMDKWTPSSVVVPITD